ncbi:MAG: hypothetical protein M1376_22675 [Planctomycetes bacterium]|nr:hypothetical protein [Planctomycetota bacterium]
MFSAKEIEYINSIKVSVVSDPEFIKAFAHDLNQGTCSDWDWPSHGTMEAFGIKFTCWRGSERMASFTAFEDYLLTDDGHCFWYESGFPDVTVFRPQEIVPFQLRYACARNLVHIWILLTMKAAPYPDPNHWCDAVRDAFQSRGVTSGGRKKRLYSDAWIAETLTCPSLRSSTDSHSPNHARASTLDGRTVDVWQSDYAMNSNCKRTSPPDTVFLFETKAGWNQHGGPELFTFDNHEPKGGCALLNDGLGTRKFIRTEEEVKQLRWK